MMYHPISYWITYIIVTIQNKCCNYKFFSTTEKNISVIRFSKENELKKEILTTVEPWWSLLHMPIWKLRIAHSHIHHLLYKTNVVPILKVNVGLFRLCFEVFQFLQYVSEVVLQIFLQRNNVFWIHSKKTVHLSHGNWENGITRKNLEMVKDINKVSLVLYSQKNDKYLPQTNELFIEEKGDLI